MTTHTEKPPFFSPAAIRFFKRTAVRLLGLLLLCLSVMLVASLLSYNTGDPSFNTATTTSVENAMGLGGAYLADIMLQFFGLSAILPVLVLIAWSARLLTAVLIERLWLKVTALILAVLCFSAVFACLPFLDSWPILAGFGGVTGGILQTSTGAVLSKTGIPYLLAWLLLPLSLCAAVFLTGYAAGMGADEWGVVRRCCVTLSGPAQSILHKRYQSFLAKVYLFIPGKAPAEALEKDTDPAPIIYAEEEPQEIAEEKKLKPLPKKKKKAAKTVQRTLDLSAQKKGYGFPPLALLAEPDESGESRIPDSHLKKRAEQLENVLHEFGVKGRIVQVRPGPVVTLYELEPAPGVKTARVIGLADDIARAMSAVSVRTAVVPGQNVIGIELPNESRETVFLKELFSKSFFEDQKNKLSMCLGKNIGGAPVYADLAGMPHLLVAGTTGSGKSVGINTMILSLLYRMPPSECRLIMIDPKMLELSIYNGIPHLLTPVVTDPSKAVVALKWAVREMEDRYKAMSQMGVRNIDGFNKKLAKLQKDGEILTRTVQTGFDPETGQPIMEEIEMDLTHMPYIVVIVDEMADLMLVAGKDVEAAIQRLAQMARAAGIHLIMATQRPSVDVITGTIKANFPTRISFQVTSKIDSRTILGEQGAEQLLGKGDMLYLAAGQRPSRVHGPFVSDEEVEAVVKHLKAQGEPEYEAAVTQDAGDGAAGAADGGEGDAESDPLYDEACAIVLRDRKVSTSYIQRQLKIGYNRAANIVDQMEVAGLVSAADHVGRREILIPEDHI